MTEHCLKNKSEKFWTLPSTVFNMSAIGVYLDSFASSISHRESYADPLISGHPQGYGDWFRNGVRQIGFNTTQNAFNKEQAISLFNEHGMRRIVAAEYFSEAMIPYIDIVMNYENARPTDLPVLENVYNQYQMTAGQRAFNTQSDTVKNAIFGRSLVWGYQLGLESIYLICPGSNCSNLPQSTQEVLQYLRTLAKAREDVQQPSIGLSWNNARFIGLADDTSNILDYSGDNDWCSKTDPSVACPATLPAVRGSLWSSSGTNAADYLVITNTTGNTIASTITVPKAWNSATLLYQSVSGATSSVSTITGTADINVPGYSVLIYKGIPKTFRK